MARGAGMFFTCVYTNPEVLDIEILIIIFIKIYIFSSFPFPPFSSSHAPSIINYFMLVYEIINIFTVFDTYMSIYFVLDYSPPVSILTTLDSSFFSQNSLLLPSYLMHPFSSIFPFLYKCSL